MKLDITIYLDSGRKISLTLEELLELRNKLSEIAPRKEPSPYYVPPLPKPMYGPIKWAKPLLEPKGWPPGTIICESGNKGV